MFTICGAAAGAVQDDVAAYEQALQQKADGALVSLLGPGKAKAMVRVTMEPQNEATNLDSAAQSASAPAGVKRLTVIVALSGSVTDADEQKVRDMLSGLFDLVAERGDAVLVMKLGLLPRQDAQVLSGGLGKYAFQGLLVLIGIFIGRIFAKMKSAAAEVKSAPAARTPLTPAPPAQFVPPPVQPQPASEESEELNIKNRHGFYK